MDKLTLDEILLMGRKSTVYLPLLRDIPIQYPSLEAMSKDQHYYPSTLRFFTTGEVCDNDRESGSTASD